MRGMVGSIGRSGGIVPAMLVLLLLFKLLIPAGYMIAVDREGAAGLVLCAPQTQPAVGTERHGGHDRTPADEAPAGSGERPCAFAALAAPFLPPPPALPSQPPAGVAVPDLLGPPALPPVATAAPPPPSTGPPISV